jgi:hypothetical protein
MAKKGSSLVCVPCGREILVTESGTAYSQLWCCGVVMDPSAKPKAAGKKAAAKKRVPAKKKAVKKKAAGKKAAKKTTAKKKAARKKK